MSQTILVKRSAVPGKVPSTTDLQLGELAINTNDGKLYMKQDDGVESIKEIGADPFPAQAGKDGQFLKTDGTSVYWSDTGGTAMRVSQPSHGFSLGALLRYNGTQYVLADASVNSTAEVVGIVTDVIDINNFELTTSGIIEFPAFFPTNFVPSTAYFLSATVPGSLTDTEPTAVGNISKPLFIALTPKSGLFYNWRGVEVMPEVDIDNLLPAQAGNDGNVLMSDGVSAGWVSVAAATASHTITAANSFTVGQLVRAQNNPTTPFVLAQANNRTNSNVYGIISYADPTKYTVTTSGRVVNMVGLTPGALYYLSDVTPGAMTAVEPATATSFSKPVFIALTATDGLFLNQRGLPVAVAQATSASLLPSVTGQSTKFLTNDGTSASWATIPTTGPAIVSAIGTTAVANATSASNADTLDGIDSTGFWQLNGIQDVSMANPTSSSSFPYAAIELRESNRAGAGTINTTTGQEFTYTHLAPRLSFHWSNRVASQISLEATGRVAILNNPGTGYENLACNIMYGRATSANYADLAENYVADAAYVVGTVLAIGGEFEVTKSTEDGDQRVVGVVSDKPAYLMNDQCQGDFVVPLALTGRTPVLVTGVIKKGDMLVSAGNGAARAESNPRIGAVIGKALSDFDGEGIGRIEVLVGKH